MRAPVLALAMGLAGCNLGPEYQRPPLTLPDSYSEGDPQAAVPDRWWTLFGEPALDALVDEALAANAELAGAAARVEEARALAGLARSEQLPEIWVQGTAARTKMSEDNPQLPPGIDVETDRFAATAHVSYELDFWGRLRRTTEAARAELLASEEGRRNVALALAADVATAYFELLAFDEALAWTRETIESRSESVRLQRLRFDAGSISELELAQVQAELGGAQAALPVLERNQRQVENRMAILLGRIGGQIVRPALSEEPALPEVPVGLPSELLTRRPDIAAAEQRLIAATARIGVARAAFFPSISLTAYAGWESQQLSNLTKAGTGVWQLALGLVQPIFAGGALRRGVEVAEAREQQLLASYTQVVQTAFAEVEDALVARRTGTAEREALERQVEALARARRLAGLRYEAGESSYLEVHDAERGLFLAELLLTRARQGELVAAVTLFKALGGGW